MKDVCGLWVEETDALTANQHNRVKTDSALGGQDYSCGFMCDVIHLTGAKSLGVYAGRTFSTPGLPASAKTASALAGQFIIGTELEAGGVDAVLGLRRAGNRCCACPRGSCRCGDSAYARARSTVFSSSSIIRRASRTVAIPSGWEALAGEAPENGVLILSGKGSAVLLRKYIFTTKRTRQASS